MEYITGIHALNLNCSLLTCGDWHQSGIQWLRPNTGDTQTSIFGMYGIEGGVTIPGHEGTYYAANHIRALLDLLEQGSYSLARGMNKDYICNDDYTEEIFEKVSMMRKLSHWPEIDRFMGKEYMAKWLDYKKQRGWRNDA